MLKSIKAPDSLVELQRWLSKMITQPLRQDHRLPFTPPQKREIAQYIAPSLTLEPYERIEIYHQQYWWRLLKCMHHNFPFVTRLFGYESFNKQIAIPYLCDHPSHHWSLSTIGLDLPKWIDAVYTENDKRLVQEAAEIDKATLVSFEIKNIKTVNFQELDEKQRLEKKIYLQPHIFLFSLNRDLFSLREELLNKEVEYWNDHPFPDLIPGSGNFVLYRSLTNTVKWKKLTSGEYKMLSYFKEGVSIQEAIEKIELEALEEANDNLALWFREWTYLKWFGEV